MPICICPHCHQQVAVREQRVRECPHCGKVFYVQFPDQDGATAIPVAEAPPVVETTRAVNDSEARRKVQGPAIGLIVTGGLTTLAGLMFLPALLFPGLMNEQVPVDPAELAFSVLFMLVSLTLGIVTLHGSIKMLQLQSYPVSMAAAIAAMVPCYCCLLGLPIGIWALIVLNDKEVKQAFK